MTVNKKTNKKTPKKVYFSFSATRCLTLTVVEVSLSRVLVTMLPNQTHPQGCVISLNTSVCSSSFSWGRITDHTSHLSITASLSHTGIKWNECRGYITEANYTQLNAVKMYFLLNQFLFVYLFPLLLMNSHKATYFTDNFKYMLSNKT